MTARRAALVLISMTAATLAACSSAGVPAESSTSASASVTQTAPSVWSAPDSSGTNSSPDTAGFTDGQPNAVTSTGPLPGLSKACSGAIRAQLAINSLFTEALNGDESTSTGSIGSPEPGSSAKKAPATPATSPASTTTGTVATTTPVEPTAADTRPANITTARVAAVFEELAPAIPQTLTTPLEELRKAADTIVGKSIPEIPAVLSSSEVTAAMQAFSHYVAACKPPSTD